MLGEYRASRTLIYIFILGKGHQKDISYFFGGFEVLDMPGMQKIETAVAVHYFFTIFSKAFCQGRRNIKEHPFAVRDPHDPGDSGRRPEHRRQDVLDLRPAASRKEGHNLASPAEPNPPAELAQDGRPGTRGNLPETRSATDVAIVAVLINTLVGSGSDSTPVTVMRPLCPAARSCTSHT